MALNTSKSGVSNIVLPGANAPLARTCDNFLDAHACGLSAVSRSDERRRGHFGGAGGIRTGRHRSLETAPGTDAARPHPARHIFGGSRHGAAQCAAISRVGRTAV